MHTQRVTRIRVSSRFVDPGRGELPGPAGRLVCLRRLECGELGETLGEVLDFDLLDAERAATDRLRRVQVRVVEQSLARQVGRAAEGTAIGHGASVGSDLPTLPTLPS